MVRKSYHSEILTFKNPIGLVIFYVIVTKQIQTCCDELSFIKPKKNCSTIYENFFLTYFNVLLILKFKQTN